jgi:hypothetical protein
VKSHLEFNHSLFLKLTGPSLLARVSYFLFFLLLGCGSFVIPFSKSKKDAIDLEGYRSLSQSDYADHLASLKISFLTTPNIRTVKMDKSIEAYFQKICNELISKNEIFFKELKTASIVILDTETPLHFSLPKGELFLSRGLISKYMKHESMLVGILAYELVRSERILYPKTTVVPIGFITLEKMLIFSRLPLDQKMEVHKWAYSITTRSGYDGEYYLSYLQTQNRNTADFILNAGDANQINREESLFKAFLIKNPQQDLIVKQNSSKEFYTVLNKLRDGVL